MCCTRLAGNTGCKKSPFWHHRTNLSGYIFRTKACIDNQKKNLLNSNTASTCPDNMVNFGLLTAEICWRVWGTPANFNRFRVLAALLHGTLVVGVSQILRHWTEGATYIRQGGHHVGHWPTFWFVFKLAMYVISLVRYVRLGISTMLTLLPGYTTIWVSLQKLVASPKFPIRGIPPRLQTLL